MLDDNYFSPVEGYIHNIIAFKIYSLLCVFSLSRPPRIHKLCACTKVSN